MTHRTFDNGVNILLELLEQGKKIPTVIFPKISDPASIDRLCNAIKNNQSVKRLNLSEVEFELEELFPKLTQLVDALEETRITSVKLNSEIQKKQKHEGILKKIQEICKENAKKNADEKNQEPAETTLTPSSK